jgi:hypothetical protein
MSKENNSSLYDYISTALEEGAMFADNGYLPACAFSAAASLKRIADYLENNEKDGQP